jgi:starch synthase (maltosyl-transferring)
VNSNVSTLVPQTTPKRIAFVTTELRPGGAERNLVALACGLDRDEFEPHVYSLAPPPNNGQFQLVERLQAEEIPVSFLQLRRSWQFFTAVRRLRDMLLQQRPHLIQSFLFHANIVCATAARGLNVPVIAGLRVAQREKLRQMVERRMAHRISKFVCVSQGVADSAVKHGGLPSEKMIVIPNGIDARRFDDVTPADLLQIGVPTDQQVVLFLGRMDRQKGVDLLIEAAGGFLPRLNDFVLLLVGDGPEKARLQRQVKQASLSSKVIFAPWQPDPLSLMAAADLVVIPSRWEGMSNTLMECIALGRPFVATNVEGTSEVVSPEGQMLIVRGGDANALAEKIVEVLENRAPISEVIDANREFLVERFPLEQTVIAYRDLYRAEIQRANTG